MGPSDFLAGATAQRGLGNSRRLGLDPIFVYAAVVTTKLVNEIIERMR